MKFYIKFQKLKGVYVVVDQPNKTQALAIVSPYRDDAIAFSEKEPVLTWKEATGFYTNWQCVSLGYIKDQCNTRKNFILTINDEVKRSDNVTLREDELLEYCKAINPKGNFFSISEGGHKKERFFVIPKRKGSHIPLIHIKEVKNFPKMLEYKETNKIEDSPIRDIEVEIEK